MAVDYFITMANISRLLIIPLLTAILIVVHITGSSANYSTPACQDVKYGCTCMDIPLEVRCMDTNLENIPEDLPDNIEILTFSGNHMEILNYIPVVYNRVRHLGLDNNSIHFLRDNCFQDMYKLEQLVMENNQISGLHGATFTGLLSLTYLDLSYNHLFELVNGTFDGSVLPALTHLSLTHCKVNQVQPDAFRNMDTLIHLNLSYNDLTLTEYFSFPVLQSLSVLDLSYNKIGYDLDYPAFNNLRSLQKLRLSGNKIRVITDKAFTGLGKDLTTLLLDNNNLYFIEQNAFTMLDQLNTLDLSYNNLEDLGTEDSEIFRIPKLIVQNNTWGCECKNDWLLHHPGIVQWNDNASLVCGSPLSLKGMPVFEVPESHFLNKDCTVPDVPHFSHPAIVIPVVMVSIFLLMVAVIMAVRWYQVRRKKAAQRANGGSGLSYSRMEEITEQAFGDTL